MIRSPQPYRDPSAGAQQQAQQQQLSPLKPLPRPGQRFRKLTLAVARTSFKG